jgi:hypothetical protein
MDLATIGRLLITFGIVVLVVGILLVIVGRVPFLGRLPGDVVFHRNGFTLFLPIATMILVSIILTVLLNIFFRFFR